MPQELLNAIQHAQRITDWMENLTREEQPPAWMWPYEDELEIWFAEVEKERNSRFGGDAEDSGSSDMIHNELAQGRGR